MKLIIISPENGDNEVQHLTELFKEGLQYFHLRKPHYNEEEIKQYLLKIPEEHHSKIILHSYHHLAEAFLLKGIHYPETDRLSAETIDLKLHTSSSYHDLLELVKCSICFDYVFLSPVFKSISKQGYESRFGKDELQKALPQINIDVVALGGVDENNIKEVVKMGFSGAALLGAIWSYNNPVEKFLSICKIIKDK